MELSDGLERGIRMLEFRTGTGLRFTVLIDRAMDICEVEFKGQSIGWHGPSGLRHPGLHEHASEGGFSWGRSFTGFLMTCGLDHIGGPEVVPADTYNYPGILTKRHGLHGRVSTIPGKLTGYGERWEGDRCILWAEGDLRQAATFGEQLTLRRRIEVDLGGNEIRLSDQVANTVSCPRPICSFTTSILAILYWLPEAAIWRQSPMSSGPRMNHDTGLGAWAIALSPDRKTALSNWSGSTRRHPMLQAKCPSLWSMTELGLGLRSRPARISCPAFTSGSTFRPAAMRWGSNPLPIMLWGIWQHANGAR